MPSDTTQQTAATLQHHLAAIAQGNLDQIMRDYSDEAILFTHQETFRWRVGVRNFFADLLAVLPPNWLADFKVIRQEVEGEVAYIFWQAPPFFPLATDTFVLRNGKIVVQTFAMLAPKP
ncbi:MAG: nuclear transport factor 2 family protein [Caldilinea sp. CFX5]|nr:nuclear transport factor 2 family protein [Caldilinea sp. CFX5]